MLLRERKRISADNYKRKVMKISKKLICFRNK